MFITKSPLDISKHSIKLINQILSMKLGEVHLHQNEYINIIIKEIFL